MSQILLNNHGGPFDGSDYPLQTHPSEVWVLEWMARLLNLKSGRPNGVIAPGTTVATQHALMTARDLLAARGHSPRGYYSGNAHHCARNTFRLLGIPCEEVHARPNGSIDIDAFADRLNGCGDAGAIIYATVGTTWKGAADDIQQLGFLVRERGHEQSWLHVDAALFGFMLPYLDDVPAWDFRVKEVSSIAVSAHKFLGCPRVAGILLMRQFDDTEQQWIDYAGSSDLCSLGSRDGIVPMWIRHLLTILGDVGMREWAKQAISVAKYAEHRIAEIGLNPLRNAFSNIVTFDCPQD
ncbi:MAG: pyridoxal-dependent decarboxylase, partial [Planctomycetota bacterium]